MKIGKIFHKILFTFETQHRKDKRTQLKTSLFDFESSVSTKILYMFFFDLSRLWALFRTCNPQGPLNLKFVQKTCILRSVQEIGTRCLVGDVFGLLIRLALESNSYWH